ncbi:MAG: VanZ family protein [Gammaproteobacteria bacterium]
MNSKIQIEIDLQLRYLWLGFGYALLVALAVLSLIPGPDIGVNDKLMHFLAYGLLSGWFSLIVRYPRSLWLVFFGLTGFGLLMEYLQGLTSYRMPDIGDAVANGLGVLLGMASRFSPLRRIMAKVDERLHALFYAAGSN